MDSVWDRIVIKCTRLKLLFLSYLLSPEEYCVYR